MSPPASSPPSPPPPDDERPLGELLSDLTSQVQALVRKEMELAKAEMKEEVTKAGKGVAAFVVAAVVGFIAAIVLAFAAAWALAEVIPTGLAFLVVGVVLLGVAGLAAVKGKAKLAQLSPVPEQTVDTVKQDVETAKESLQRGASGAAYPDPWRKN
jgi:ABC-type multidrug transport system fused ATPase/permease subunit